MEDIGPRRAALEEQVRLLDMVTASQVDGIITEGVSDEQIAAAIAKAVDRGIPVITMGKDLPSGRRLACATEGVPGGAQPGITVVATETSGLNRAVALHKTWEMLRQHPQVNVLYGTTALNLVGIAQGVNTPE